MRTDLLIFSVPALIEMISVAMSLERGDVIITGTPSGVGAARTAPVFMQPGDIFEAEIEGLGVLTNSAEEGWETCGAGTAASVHCRLRTAGLESQATTSGHSPRKATS